MTTHTSSLVLATEIQLARAREDGLRRERLQEAFAMVAGLSVIAAVAYLVSPGGAGAGLLVGLLTGALAGIAIGGILVASDRRHHRALRAQHMLPKSYVE